MIPNAWKLALLMGGASLVLGGCESSDDGTDNPGNSAEIVACEDAAATSTWEAIQRTVFVRYQCTGCHNDTITEGDLNLASEDAWSNLVYAPSTSSMTGMSHRIFPGDHDASLLFKKLEAAITGEELPHSAGGPMPPSGYTAIAETDLEAMRLWIRSGANKTGVVAGTQNLLNCGLPVESTPNKLPPLEAPPEGEGVQFLAGPWPVEAMSEDEVCFATYYDLTNSDLVPESARRPCTSREGGSDKTCIAYKSDILAQDPQSHHSIVDIYTGSTGPDNTWGQWTCHGGSLEGTSCDPTEFSRSASDGGADCGAGGKCASAVTSSTACIGFGPSDARSKQIGISGSQEPVQIRETYGDGVYRLVPIKGVVIWNSHAFNLTSQDTTLEQYINIYFASEDEQLHRQRTIFDSEDIFAMYIPPYEEQEICASYTIPKGAHLVRIGSHVHQRGVKFRAWYPPNDPDCSPDNDCQPREDEPFYTSFIYNDPLEINYAEPLIYDSDDAAERTFRFCSVFDNGLNYPHLVKRHSLSVGSKCSSAIRACYGGPKQGEVCSGDDSFCDSSPGHGDGLCDACPVWGGVTTEDEMFIFLGGYYLPGQQ